jgi:hypothetical protein
VAPHPFARLKSVTLEKLATEALVGLSRKDYPEPMLTLLGHSSTLKSSKAELA